FYLFDRDSGEIRYLFSVMPWIDPEEMHEKQAIRLKARDGLELHGYVSLPKSRAGKPAPMIVIPHGGPHGVRDYWQYDPEQQFFTSRGFAVLQINFRGSGGYGMPFERAGFGEWGLKMQDDVTDATLWAIEQGYADPDRICIHGGSFGAYSALMGVIREPDLYKCAVGYAGVYDLKMLAESFNWNKGKWMKWYNQAVLGADKQELKARSINENVDKIKVPIFLAHGKKDVIADFEHFKVLTDALEENDVSLQTLVEPREGHGFYDVDNRVRFYSEVLKFIATHTRHETSAALR
ncbi:MAG: prolyl oligopeptidase family serine peptidase, partial [Gammaproteobacteria bacterium]|nr:prolyl oligopeptidase family serine peptidase [Gammaproteobacteria bacterium]